MQCFRKLSKVCSNCCDTGLARYFQTSRVVLFDEDPLTYFNDKKVNYILRKITGDDTKKAIYKHKIEKAVTPKYLVLTDKELQKTMTKAEGIKKRRLQMPPFMKCREDRDKLLEDDPDIASILESKYVFFDITDDNSRYKRYGERPMVIRHRNGKLKMADWHTYDRVSQIYNPFPGREIYMPKMFKEDHLEELLDTYQNYLYILERACVQFEPDSSDFIRVTHRIYEHIAEHGCFDVLRSTRFFGPMAFYFAMINKIEPLMADMIDRNLLSDAVDLINLKKILHKESEMHTQGREILMIIQDFYNNEANKKHIHVLEEALGRLEKRLEERLQEEQSN